MLERAVAVVCHGGGMGMVQKAVAAGVPIVRRARSLRSVVVSSGEPAKSAGAVEEIIPRGIRT